MALTPADYRPERFEALTEAVQARSWHYLADMPGPGATPATLLPGCLDEPVVITVDDDGEVRALSNVCTHRGNLVCARAGPTRKLRCGYHGRTFGLDGKAERSPGFPAMQPADDLPRLPLARLGPMLFTTQGDRGDWLAPARRLLGGLPLDRTAPDPTGARTYEIDAHWLLWVENYLEGFHIPFVHPELARSLDLAAYRTEVDGDAVVQVGPASRGEPVLDLPSGHPYAGEALGGLYLWLWPTTALNIYPWGISLNAVQPLGPARTRILYRRYIWAPEHLGAGAGGDLDTVERQDDAVVEAVQRGTTSRMFRGARHSLTEEPGVVHLHRLVEQALSRTAPR